MLALETLLWDRSATKNVETLLLHQSLSFTLLKGLQLGLLLSTVNVTGETLVLNKNFAGFMLGKFLLYA